MRAIRWSRNNANKQQAPSLTKRMALAIVALAIGVVAPLQGVMAAPGDVTWEKAGTTGVRDYGKWQSIASSADGTKLAAIAYYGYIYTSADSGTTWTEQTASGSRGWTSIASSSDGTKLAAVVDGSYIYSSTDSGVTWIAQPSTGLSSVKSIASSSDGTRLVIAASYYGGYILTSTDSGATWSTTLSIPSGSVSVTSSSDGTKLAALEYNGYIHTSTNSGATWMTQYAAGARYWRSISSSADGTALVAVAISNNNAIYTSSDSGATWTERTVAGSDSWLQVASSNDGTKLAAVGYSDTIYTSSDSGATWTERNFLGTREWVASAASQDGSHIVAADYEGSIWVSADFGVSWAEHELNGGPQNWRGVTISHDGTKLSAIGGYYGGSFMYTSTDSGVNWTEQQTPLESSGFRSIASSSDGTKLAILGQYSSYIHTSTDSGANWTKRISAGQRDWHSVASSADGSVVVAGISYDPEGGSDGDVAVSTDSGATWTFHDLEVADTNGFWSVGLSADGGKMVAATGTYGHIYTSSDFGATWMKQAAAPESYWYDVEMSPDGSKIMAVNGDSGYVYLSHNSGATWEQTEIWSYYWEDTDAISFSGDGRTMVVATDGPIYLGKVEGAATATFNLATLSGASQAATADAVRNATISATSMTCYALSTPSIATFGTSGVSAPTSGINLLGGVAFNLTCTAAGGSSDVELALGAHYTDVSKLRAYKTSGTALTDITSQVTFTNKDVGGSTKTVVSYQLVDGGALDEDKATNSTIVDPIYIGEVAGASSTSPTAAGGSLANTGLSVYLVTALAGTLLVSASVIWRKGLKLGRRVSFR